MTYQSKEDLPETLRITLPDGAQTIYINAYNQALVRDDLAVHGSLTPDAAAHAVAWQAVEEEFEQDKDGKWYRKGEGGQVLEAESEGLLDKVKSVFSG